VLCAKHLIIFIFNYVLAFVFLMCSSQFILVSNVSPKMQCCRTCSIFSPFAHMFILGLVVIGNFLWLNMIALVFSIDNLNLVSSAHLIIPSLLFVFELRLLVGVGVWCVPSSCLLSRLF
jgi:hypothetical protein